MLHFTNTDQIYTKSSVFVWLVSAFKSGFINSAGFLLSGKFVSHVTGFGTQMGIAFGHDDFLFGTELLIIPMAFIGGGVITSWILDKDYATDEVPSYYLVQGLITILLAVIVIMGESAVIHNANHFDDDMNYDITEFSIIAMLCLICGLKNSLVTWSTFGKIRVTHLTGLSTDIGLNLIRTFKPNQPAPRFKEPRKINTIRLLTFVAFSLGAFMSAILYPQIGYKCFLIVFAISLTMTVITYLETKRSRRTVTTSKA